MSEYGMQPATKEDLGRVEKQIADLTLAIKDMILLGERQRNQGERIGALEQDIATITSQYQDLKEKVNAWINRGIGAWAIAVIVWGLVKFVLENKP